MFTNNNTVSKRNIILHYHFFKNAGTSIDKILKANFPSSWKEHDVKFGKWLSPDVGKFLEENNDITVLSSHTALLPLPKIPNATIYPIIILRHPLDRVRSIYDFERKQNAMTPGSQAARKYDISEYILWRFSRNDRVIRNFHSFRLAMACESGASERERAIATIQQFPFVGVVEEFSLSLFYLQNWLKPVFPSIIFNEVKENVTSQSDFTLDERLDAFKSRIGSKLYYQLKEENLIDIELHKIALNLLGKPIKLDGTN